MLLFCSRIQANVGSEDMLEEFSSVKVDSKKPELVSGPGRPAPADPSDEPKLDDLLSDDEFAKQLQAGMADLLGEVESSVSWGNDCCAAATS